jgi:8-oxo-dGTP pyrophosphatase MutT (NUDIX family)/ribosomal protein S18 acetylase RimI-like enzyme
VPIKRFGVRIGESYRKLVYAMRKVSVIGLQHRDFPGLWLHGVRRDNGKLAMPGGHAVPGETATETALRELQEEVGLSMQPQDLQECRSGCFSGDRGDVTVTLFVATCPADAKFNVGDDPDSEFSELRWIDPTGSHDLHVPKRRNLLVRHIEDGPKTEVRKSFRSTPTYNLHKGLRGDWKKEGYTLKVVHERELGHGEPSDPAEKDPTRRAFGIRAYDPAGNRVGFASFDHEAANPYRDQHPESYIYPREVGVSKNHRRKGIATAMYQMAEKVSGKRLRPEDLRGGQQTAAARYLWSQRRRPFGRGYKMPKLAKSHVEVGPYKLYHARSSYGNVSDRGARDPKDSHFDVTVYHGDQKVGHAEFLNYRPDQLQVHSIKMVPEHKGVAEHVLRYAQRLSGGKKLVRSTLAKSPPEYAFSDSFTSDKFADDNPPISSYDPQRSKVKTARAGSFKGKPLFHHVIQNGRNVPGAEIQHLLSFHKDPSKNGVAHISGEKDRDALQVYISTTDSRYRGMGLGTKLYELAAKHHGALSSDFALSHGSDAIYRKLAKKPGFKAKLREWGDPQGHYLRYFGERRRVKKSDVLEKSDETVKLYHLTDRSRFKLDPSFAPQDNSISIVDRSGRKGIYTAPNVESWVNGYGYARPFVAELHVPKSLLSEKGVGGRWGGEVFIPSEHFDKVKVHRVIPIDAHAREQYGEYGWFEGALGTGFDTGKMIDTKARAPFKGYKYTGKDVRSMSPEEVKGLKQHFRAGYKARFGKSEYYFDANHFARHGTLKDVQDPPPFAYNLKKGLKGDWQKEGYTFKYLTAENRSNNITINGKRQKNYLEGVYHTVTAHDKTGKKVGTYGFHHVHHNNDIGQPDHEIDVSSAYTDPAHRRKGLATEAYRIVQEKAGVPIRNSPDSRTELANKLWSQPDRQKKFGKKELIPSGKASGRKPSEFDREQLKAGVQVEMEHTDDPRKALEIAMDHLAEDPQYYTKLKQVHDTGQWYRFDESVNPDPYDQPYDTERRLGEGRSLREVLLNTLFKYHAGFKKSTSPTMNKTEYFAVLHKSKNVREQRKKLFGRWKTQAGSKQRKKQMGQMKEWVESRYKMPVKRAKGKMSATGQVIDKPDLTTEQLQHIGNPDSLIHEVAHLEVSPEGMPVKRFQEKMDELWSQQNVRYGFKQQARLAPEYEATAIENILRRRLGLPAHAKTRKLTRPEEQERAADRPELKVVRDYPGRPVKARTKSGALGVGSERLTAGQEVLSPEARQLLILRDSSKAIYDPKKGWRSVPTVDTFIRLREEGFRDTALALAREYFLDKRGRGPYKVAKELSRKVWALEPGVEKSELEKGVPHRLWPYRTGEGVTPEHRRRGIASAMYQYAEQVSGKRTRPSSERSWGARKLWGQPKRMFGKINTGDARVPAKDYWRSKLDKSLRKDAPLNAFSDEGQQEHFQLGRKGTEEHHTVVYEPAKKKMLTKSESYFKLWKSSSVLDAARSFASSKGVLSAPSVKINPEHGARIAHAYEGMRHAPDDPHVQSAYGALSRETREQFQHLLNSGLKISRIEPGQENPYRSSKDLFHDLQHNNHLWFFPTDQGFGSQGQPVQHPLLQESGFSHRGKPLLDNDVFRIVHDVFGHAVHGHGFGPKGEHAAYLVHRQMYSPEAGKALASETMGQNNWVNWGPHGEANRRNPSQTKYADQKAGLLPDEILGGEWHR